MNEQGYADVAVNYLNGFKENPVTCPPELIEQLDLQIGIQTLEWLKTIRDPAQRATLMDQCQQSFVDFLASNPNRVFKRAQLLQAVWGYDYYGDYDESSRTVDVHIKRLREKLEGVSDKWCLKTIWSVGYKFETKE